MILLLSSFWTYNTIPYKFSLTTDMKFHIWMFEPKNLTTCAEAAEDTGPDPAKSNAFGAAFAKLKAKAEAWQTAILGGKIWKTKRTLCFVWRWNGQAEARGELPSGPECSGLDHCKISSATVGLFVSIRRHLLKASESCAFCQKCWSEGEKKTSWEGGFGQAWWCLSLRPWVFFHEIKIPFHHGPRLEVFYLLDKPGLGVMSVMSVFVKVAQGVSLWWGHQRHQHRARQLRFDCFI